jgi:hypothetical protein
MAQLAINTSPLQCRWIATGSEMRLEQWSYATEEPQRHPLAWWCLPRERRGTTVATADPR